MRIPVNQPYVITTAFGVPDSNAKFGFHSGIDYAVPLGRPVYAPASGSLKNIVSPTGGNMVQIFDGIAYHRLMHNRVFSRNDGQVNEGDQVAEAGSTGLSTGPHVHWDVATEANPSRFGVFIDPMEYIKGEDIMEAGKVYEELNKRDKRLDELAKQIDTLYKIVDTANKNIEKLLANPGGFVDGDYTITKKG